MSDDPNAREEGFYWVVLGQNPPEIAYWERGEWWLAGDARPWQPAAANVLSDELVFIASKDAFASTSEDDRQTN